jgi:hypothetical protein
MKKDIDIKYQPSENILLAGALSDFDKGNARSEGNSTSLLRASTISAFLMAAPCTCHATTVNINFQDFKVAETSIVLDVNNRIDQLLNTYVPVNEIELKKFLSINNFLINEILKAHSEILKYFEGTLIQIELITDVEVSNWQTVFIKIPGSSEFETDFNKLNTIGQNWLFLQSKEFKKLVTISLV